VIIARKPPISNTFRKPPPPPPRECLGSLTHLVQIPDAHLSSKGFIVVYDNSSRFIIKYRYRFSGIRGLETNAAGRKVELLVGVAECGMLLA